MVRGLGDFFSLLFGWGCLSTFRWGLAAWFSGCQALRFVGLLILFGVLCLAFLLVGVALRVSDAGLIS